MGIAAFKDEHVFKRIFVGGLTILTGSVYVIEKL